MIAESIPKEFKAKTRRFTLSEYHSMVDLGFFESERVELIEGDIVKMSPQKPAHSSTSKKIAQLLEHAFGPGYFALQHSPITLRGPSEPEPDVAVIKGKADDFHNSHPRTAELVVEVSLSSYSIDRYRKASIYAHGAIREYWIVDLRKNQLEVLREPTKKSAKSSFYSSIHFLLPGATVSPLALPKTKIAVADLFPPTKK